MGQWEEAFDSSLLYFLFAISALSWFAIFIYGEITGQNLNYVLLLMAGTLLSFAVYVGISGLPDWRERVEGNRILAGTLLGFAGVVVVSLMLSGALGRVASAIWVPQNLVPLQAQDQSQAGNQYLFDLVLLATLVPQAERGLVAIGGVFTLATGIGENQPIYLQPGFLVSTGVWASLHVVFGQNPLWFFFVAFGAGEAMLIAAHYAGDYTAAVLSHGMFDVTVRTLSFLGSGGLTISQG